MSNPHTETYIRYNKTAQGPAIDITLASQNPVHNFIRKCKEPLEKTILAEDEQSARSPLNRLESNAVVWHSGYQHSIRMTLRLRLPTIMA